MFLPLILHIHHNYKLLDYSVDVSYNYALIDKVDERVKFNCCLSVATDTFWTILYSRPFYILFIYVR